MTATINPPSISNDAHPAVDAFNPEAVEAKNLASARVVSTAGKYEDEFDDEVTLGGRRVDVRVCYPNTEDEVDVFVTNDAALPVWPEISHWLSTGDRERLLAEAEKRFALKRDEKNDGAIYSKECREYHEWNESGRRV